MFPLSARRSEACLLYILKNNAIDSSNKKETKCIEISTSFPLPMNLLPVTLRTVSLPLSIAVESTSALALQIPLVDPVRRRLRRVHYVFVRPLQIFSEHFKTVNFDWRKILPSTRIITQVLSSNHTYRANRQIHPMLVERTL